MMHHDMSACLVFRVARAATFAVVCVLLSTVAHAVAGGAVCGHALAGELAVAFGAGLAATGRERGTGPILALLAFTQVVLHVLLSSSAPAPSGMEMVGGHLHLGPAPRPAMVLVHGCATVLTALWLARGESALWALLRLLGSYPYRLVLASPQAVGVPGRGRAAVPELAVPRSAATPRRVSDRGPPARPPRPRLAV